eukprot:snap_masked-scaffold_10-processed-gene-8.29-mRNA-1 protein AED:1.00 eAED:1.00 QI:0/0/0/0/1/1/2/0/360
MNDLELIQLNENDIVLRSDLNSSCVRVPLKAVEKKIPSLLKLARYNDELKRVEIFLSGCLKEFLIEMKVFLLEESLVEVDMKILINMLLFSENISDATFEEKKLILFPEILIWDGVQKLLPQNFIKLMKQFELIPGIFCERIIQCVISYLNQECFHKENDMYIKYIFLSCFNLKKLNFTCLKALQDGNLIGVYDLNGSCLHNFQHNSHQAKYSCISFQSHIMLRIEENTKIFHIFGYRKVELPFQPVSLSIQDYCIIDDLLRTNNNILWTDSYFLNKVEENKDPELNIKFSKLKHCKRLQVKRGSDLVYERSFTLENEIEMFVFVFDKECCNVREPVGSRDILFQNEQNEPRLDELFFSP